MQQLLTIETVPISIEYRSSKTAKDPAAQSAKLRITKANSGTTIKSNPIKIKMDTFETAGDPKRTLQTSASSINLSYEATARYGEKGNLQLDIRLIGDPIEGLDFQRVERSIESVMNTMPSMISDLPSAGRDMRINYEMSGLMADSGVSPISEFNFIPGDLEFKIKEYPKIIIKYIGKPIYIPKSSDPDYVPPEKLDVIV